MKDTPRPVEIAWIQGKDQGNAESNIAYYLDKARQFKNVDLIVFPELFFHHYFPIVEDDHFFDLAIKETDQKFDAFKALAKDLNAVLVVPFFERTEDNKFYNTALVLERDGTVAGKYRKMHIPYEVNYYEKHYFADGDLGFEPIKTSAGVLGVMICWDQWFPEAARIMKIKGAEILIYPTAIAWGTNPSEADETELDSWITVMRSHSICNGVYTIAVNRVGTEGPSRFWGHSFVCLPSGQLMNKPTVEEEVFQTTIDLSKNDTHNIFWPFFRDRRVDHYGDILEKSEYAKLTPLSMSRLDQQDEVLRDPTD